MASKILHKRKTSATGAPSTSDLVLVEIGINTYDGKLYNTGFFETSRVCMHKCNYCINRAFQVFQEDAGLVRRNKYKQRCVVGI